MSIEYLGKQISEEEWSDWHWQMQNRISLVSELGALGVPVDEANETALRPLAMTPHQANQLVYLMHRNQMEDMKAILRTLLPDVRESIADTRIVRGKDGTGTDHKKKVYGEFPDSIRRLYRDRAILMASGLCSCNCRYCFRRSEAGYAQSDEDVQGGIDYIRVWNKTHPNDQIRDVILSGGDPLTLSDIQLQAILSQLHEIPGVEIIRVDTKFAASLPQRFTPELIELLGKYVHLLCFDFCHPGEISPETIQVCQWLAKQGIIMRAYAPFLDGVNASREVLIELFWKLLFECKVTPYYLVQMIDTPGLDHFKVPIEKGIEMMDRLQVDLSGVAVPKYICYLPNGGGKVELSKQTFYSRTEKGCWLRSSITGETALYPDPIR